MTEAPRPAVPAGTAGQVVRRLSYRLAAQRVGMSRSALHRRVSRMGQAIRYDPEGRPLAQYVVSTDGRLRLGRRYDTTDRDCVIRGLRAEGLTIRAIAAEVGWSRGTVHRVLSRDDA